MLTFNSYSALSGFHAFCRSLSVKHSIPAEFLCVMNYVDGRTKYNLHICFTLFQIISIYCRLQLKQNCKRLKRLVVSFFYIDDVYFVSTEISLKKFFFRNFKYRSMILYGFSLCSMRTIHCRIFYI